MCEKCNDTGVGADGRLCECTSFRHVVMRDKTWVATCDLRLRVHSCGRGEVLEQRMTRGVEEKWVEVPRVMQCDCGLEEVFYVGRYLSDAVPQSTECEEDVCRDLGIEPRYWVNGSGAYRTREDAGRVAARFEGYRVFASREVAK